MRRQARRHGGDTRRLVVVLAVFERIAIQNLNGARPREPDQAALFKITQRTADSFDRGGQEIRDFISGDGKRDLVALARRQTVGHRKNERADLLLDPDAADY